MRNSELPSRVTGRQREIYEFIRGVINSRGSSPTMREIGEQFGIRSTNGVEKHLLALERSGFIIRERGKSRGLFLHAGDRTVFTVPLIGRVAAGLPVLSPENREDDLTIDLSLFGIRSGQRLFALRVKGESMIEAHIMDGDVVLVRQQASAQNSDIIVALVEGEATVKRYFLEKDRVRLQPENRDMQPIFLDRGEFRILGKVAGAMRKI